MSNKTFNITSDQVEHTVALPHRDLGLFSESHYSDSSLSPSPESDSHISNLNNREANSSPDVNMMDCCLSDHSSVDNPYNTTLPSGNVLCGVHTNLNQTYIATPVNGSVNFWNENLSLMSNHETGSEKYQTFSKTTEDGSNSELMSPDSAGKESHLGSSETSRRGSSENDCCSLSSGEMVIRSNSFCREDRSLLVVSPLEDSSMSLAAGHSALPAESNLLSTTLLDVCEKSPVRVIEENTGQPCLGMTFTQAELPTEENDLATSNSVSALPSENEGGFLMTFVCEPSPPDCGKEASAEVLLLHCTGGFTPEQGKTLVSPLSAVQDTDRDIHTSTPLQNTAHKILSLPPLTESPCAENTGSTGLHPVIQQQVSVKPKQRLVVGVPPSRSKVKKMEIRKFPMSDYSSVKSKVVTRNVHQMSVPGPQYKQAQVNVYNKHTEAHRGQTISLSPVKVRSSTTVVSSSTKAVSNTQKQVNRRAVSSGVRLHLSGQPAVDRERESRASPPSHHAAANKHALAVQCSNASSETELAASSQVADTAAQHAGNKAFCLSSLEKSPDRSGQTESKPTPKRGELNKIEVRSSSALGQDKSPVLSMRPRCSSESSSSTSRPPREKRTPRFTTSFITPYQRQTKPGKLNRSPQNKRAKQDEATKETSDNSRREVKRISLVTSRLTAAGASLDERKSRSQGNPSPRRTKGALSQAPAASPRPAALSTRQRRAAAGRDECKTSQAVGTPQSKPKSSAGNLRVEAREPSFGTASTAGIKPQLDGSRPPQTPTRPSLMGHPPTPATRQPRKTLGPSRSLTEASDHTELNEGSGNIQVLAAACKPATPNSKGASNSAVSLLKRPASARLVRPISGGRVDKNKPKTSSCQQPPQDQSSQPSQNNGPAVGVPPSVAEDGKKDQQLRGLLAASNCRFEAVAIVLQQILAERDEATRQCSNLSQELVNLRGELVCSVHSSERLEKEKDELRVALEEALQKLKEQHQKDLAELEQRLQAFYQAEWDKIHLTYQEEADKCKTLMQQQMVELKANHEAMKLELERSHTQQLQSVKQQYEKSLEELSKVHNQELQSLDKTSKDAEVALSGQIEMLTAENKALIEKLTEEEDRRKALADSQKDSHTLYLEQELESLKVVLEIKNKQLHQQEKKMIEIDQLKEKNVKLDESLKKAQQENEDLKARMDRHAALSRQLSTEQAVLQESLQKESKMNKRLSMENEELLWKLHNGDLSSPRKVSPTSTSRSNSFSLQSPPSSGLFSSPAVSPR